MKCIVIDDDRLVHRILQSYVERTDSLIFLGAFADSRKAIDYLRQNPDIGLVFLDIQMPGMGGFEFLDSLDRNPQIVVISSSEEYALRAFDYDATDYLLKPIGYERFYQSVSKAIRWSHSASMDEQLYLKREDTMVKVAYSDIVWIEAMENYVGIFTDRDRFVMHFTMKSAESQMPSQMFRRIHRSYIVNLSRVLRLDGENAIVCRMGRPVTLPIGRSYKAALFESLRFMEGELK